jgi:hypothetical protein
VADAGLVEELGCGLAQQRAVSTTPVVLVSTIAAVDIRGIATASDPSAIRHDAHGGSPITLGRAATTGIPDVPLDGTL